MECFESLLRIGLSPYAKLRAKAIPLIDGFLRVMPRHVSRACNSKLLCRLRSPEDEHEMKALLQILCSAATLRAIEGDWLMVKRASLGIVLAKEYPQAEIEKIMVMLISKVVNVQIPSLAEIFPKEKHVMRNYKLYMELVSELVDVASTPGAHWRTAEFAAAFISSIQSIFVKHPLPLPLKAVEFLLKGLLHENPIVRNQVIGGLLLTYCSFKYASQCSILVDSKGIVPPTLIDWEAVLQNYDPTSTTTSIWKESYTVNKDPQHWIYHRTSAEIETDVYKKTDAYVYKLYLDGEANGYYAFARQLKLRKIPLTTDLISSVDTEDRPSSKCTPFPFIPGITAADRSKLKALTLDFFSAERVAEILRLTANSKSKFSEHTAFFWKGIFQYAGAPIIERCIPVWRDLLRPVLLQSENHAKEDEKAIISVVMSCMAGFFRGALHWSDSARESWGSAALEVLLNVAVNCTQAAFDICLCVIQFAVHDGDPRRWVTLIDTFQGELTKFLSENPTFDEISTPTLKRLLSLNLELIIWFRWKDVRYLEVMLSVVMQLINAPFSQIRDMSGSILCDILMNCVVAPINSPPGAELPFEPAPVTVVDTFLKEVTALVVAKGKQAKNIAKSVLAGLAVCSTTAATPYLQYVMAIVICGFNNLEQSTDDDYTVLLNSTIAMLVSTAVYPNSASKLICLTEKMFDDSPHEVVKRLSWECPVVCTSWRARQVLVRFIKNIMAVHQVAMWKDAEVLECCRRRVCRCLDDPMREVQDMALSSISLLVQVVPSIAPSMALQFDKWASDKNAPSTMTESARKENKEYSRLGGILGLCALVNAFPTCVPQFLPSALCALARHERTVSAARPIVRNTFAEFWKTHQEMWDLEYQHMFTDDQREVVRGFMYSPSYFA